MSNERRSAAPKKPGFQPGFFSVWGIPMPRQRINLDFLGGCHLLVDLTIRVPSKNAHRGTGALEQAELPAPRTEWQRKLSTNWQNRTRVAANYHFERICRDECNFRAI